MQQKLVELEKKLEETKEALAFNRKKEEAAQSSLEIAEKQQNQGVIAALINNKSEYARECTLLREQKIKLKTDIDKFKDKEAELLGTISRSLLVFSAFITIFIYLFILLVSF